MAASQAEIVSAVAEALKKKNISQQAVQVVGRATEKVLKRVHQDFSASVQESCDDAVGTFCKNLAVKLGNMAQNWYDHETTDLLVYPEGTRFIHREGQLTTVAIEQPPQIRTVNIEGRNYHLSFPFTVFILTFNKSQWTGQIHVTFRPKALGSMNDMLFEAGLPNMSGGYVCMGDFNNGHPSLKNQNLTIQVNNIIGAFWQSKFTFGGGNDQFSRWIGANDLSAKNGNNRSWSTSITEWEKKSKKEPLWAVNGRMQSSGSLKDNIDGAVNAAGRASGSKTQNDIVKDMKQEIVTAVGTIGAEYKKAIMKVDFLKQNKEKVQIENLEEILKEIIVQSYSELWEYLQGQLAKERQKHERELQEAIKKLTENSKKPSWPAQRQTEAKW